MSKLQLAIVWVIVNKDISTFILDANQIVNQK